MIKPPSDKISASSSSGMIADSINIDQGTLDEPVSATIMRDVRKIGIRLRHVLVPNNSTESELRNWDLWGLFVRSVIHYDEVCIFPNGSNMMLFVEPIGPLIFCLMLAMSMSFGTSDDEVFLCSEFDGLTIFDVVPSGCIIGIYCRIRHCVVRSCSGDSKCSITRRQNLVFPECLRVGILPVSAEPGRSVYDSARSEPQKHQALHHHIWSRLECKGLGRVHGPVRPQKPQRIGTVSCILILCHFVVDDFGEMTSRSTDPCTNGLCWRFSNLIALKAF